jgi:D-glucosaminate-6-phosphate ammonia-lyase
MLDIYRELGIEPVINASGTITRMGGSLMPPEVTDAMAAAARSFVDMEELHLAAGRRVAEMVGAEAAHVCNGATAGIALMAAACMAGSDGAKILQLPDTTGMKRRFVVQRAHRNPFDQALRVAGGEFVEVDSDAAELERALTDDVAGIFCTVAWFCPREVLPLPQVAEIAHRAGIPVIVDASAEVPPAENLSRFIREGADLVAFSGGKAIRGPQASGFILGRPDLIEACRRNDCPNMSVGRSMKAGKEEIVGLVKAVELYIRKDHAAEMAVWERRVGHILESLGDMEHVRVWRQLPHGIGQQIPHAAVSWDEAALGVTHVDAVRRLKEGRPRIAAQLIGPQRYAFAGFTAPELRLHPHTLQEGEEIVVARRLRETVTGR